MKQVAVPAEGTPGTCEAGSPVQALGPTSPTQWPARAPLVEGGMGTLVSHPRGQVGTA